MSKKEIIEAQMPVITNYERVLREYRNFEGKILTIVDSSVIDRQQNKAMKSLICQVLFSSKFRLLEDLKFIGQGEIK